MIKLIKNSIEKIQKKLLKKGFGRDTATGIAIMIPFLGYAIFLATILIPVEIYMELPWYMLYFMTTPFILSIIAALIIEVTREKTGRHYA